MRRWRVLTAIVLTLTLLFTMSCAATETTESTPAPDEPTATSEPEAEATDTPTEEAMEPEPTETPTEEAMEPSPTPSEEEEPAPTLEADALSGLDSYRAELTWRAEGEMAQEMNMEIAETRDPQARHIALTTQGNTFEIISIEDQTWVKANGTWQQLPGGVESFLGEMTFIAPEDVSDIAAEEEGDYEFVGSEAINGVPTLHYRFEADPEDVAQATDATEVQEVMGDVWVTDDPDLPAFAMRLHLEYETEIEGQMRTATMTWEVKEVNSGLTIEPPE